MGDALRGKFTGLEGRDDLVMAGAKKAFNCRFLVRLSVLTSLNLISKLMGSRQVSRAPTQVVSGRNGCLTGCKTRTDCHEDFHDILE